QPKPGGRLLPAPEPVKTGSPATLPLSEKTPPPPGPEAPSKPVIAQMAAVAPSAEAQRPRQVSTGPGGAAMRMVNTRRIMLDYALADIPHPDQAMLELWYTQDGRKWTRDETQLKGGSPYMVEVNREGTYGFTLVARRRGEASLPPAAGEQPQVWVEVDWTKPV